MDGHFVLVVELLPGALTLREDSEVVPLCLPPSGEQWIYVGIERPRCATDVMRMILAELEAKGQPHIYKLHEGMVGMSLTPTVLVYSTEEEARFAVKTKRQKLVLDGKYTIRTDEGDCYECGNKTRDYCPRCRRHTCATCSGYRHPLCKPCGYGQCISCGDPVTSEWIFCDKCDKLDESPQ